MRGLGARDLSSLATVRSSAYVVMEALEGGDLRMMLLRSVSTGIILRGILWTRLCDVGYDHDTACAIILGSSERTLRELTLKHGRLHSVLHNYIIKHALLEEGMHCLVRPRIPPICSAMLTELVYDGVPACLPACVLQMTGRSCPYRKQDALRWLLNIAQACHYLHDTCKPMIIHRWVGVWAP